MKQKELEEELGLVNRLTRVILSVSGLAEIGRRFVYELRELVDLDWGAIALMEDASDSVRLLPLCPEFNSQGGTYATLPLEDTPVSWVARERRAFLEADIQAEGRFKTSRSLGERGLRTVAYMPLFNAGKVFGILIFASRRPQAYKERELRLLKYATTQITAPIWQFRLTQETEKRSKASQLCLSEEERQRLVSAITHEVREEIRKVLSELRGSII